MPATKKDVQRHVDNSKEFYKPTSLLNVNADYKTKKGVKLGILTGIMYLAPHTSSGFQTCPKASEGCKNACLYTAGRGGFNTTQIARINKTKWFFNERNTFMAKLVKDVQKVQRKAKRDNLKPAIRLNGTSDISWEKFKVELDGKTYPNIMSAFPDVQFYDYTKIRGRKKAIALPNYHLTFSLSEDNDKDAELAIQEGYNVAVVMKVKRTGETPTTWGGFPALDGDDTDVRFLDPKGGHVVALRAKGSARSDDSGFVRSPVSGFNNIDIKVVG